MSSVLEEAKSLARRLGEYCATEKHFPELGQRAQQLEQALRHRIEVIEHPAPRIAFFAHKGVGKSTLINSLANLWLDTPPPSDATSKHLNQQALLPLGNGGTTPCEIRIEAGSWEIRVEPEKPTETLAQIRQFAEWAWHKAHDPKKQTSEAAPAVDEHGPDMDEPPAGGSPPRLQPDIERVIRGMTGLHEHSISVPSPDGARGRRSTTTRHDAVELAAKFQAKGDFVAEVVKKAELPNRRRQQWLPEGDSRRWVRETLLNLFEGKFHDQPFPKQVVIRTPSTGIRWKQSDLPLIDTLGLPAVAAPNGGGPAARTAPPLAGREDLRNLLKDPWTVLVVGAQFNEPPAPSVELLQEMIAEGVRFGETLEDRTIIAIVDPGKAGTGNFADASTERAQKEDRCAENLVNLGCPRGAEHPNRWTVDTARERVVCVNVLDGGTEILHEFLENSVERMAAQHSSRLEVAVEEAASFFRNLGDAKRQALRTQIVAEFKNYLAAQARTQLGKVRAFRANLLHPFANECRSLHASTLRSVIVNRGDGRSQSAWAMLESSTTREMTNVLKPWRNAIGTVSEALRSNARYQDENARDVIAEEADRRGRMATAFLLSFVAEFVEEAKTLLLAAGGLWQDCDNEWGQGIKSPRYKERVAQHFEQWGINNSPSLMNSLAHLESQADADDSGILRSLIDK